MIGGQVRMGQAVSGMAEDTQCRPKQEWRCQGKGQDCSDGEHLEESESNLKVEAGMQQSPALVHKRFSEA